MSRDLQTLFEPQSVVVVGASGTPNRPGNDVVKNLQANAFQGKIYLVNPKGGDILGINVHRSIQELPDGIDIGIIILPARHNAAAIRECAQKGIKFFFLAAGGFSEVDAQGATLQEELVRVIAETGVRVIGPNTSGHTSTPYNFTSAFFPLGKIPRGSVAYISQTGNFATHTMRYIITGEHFGVSRVIGLGNKLDIDESDALEYLADDPETTAILMYLESLKRPRHFMEIARQVTRVKPVIVLKAGSTTRGVSAAVAHTAALASDDRIIDGALRQVGITRTHKYSHLIWAAKALSCMPLPKGNRVSFLAPSGGMLVTLTDLCEQHLELEVPDVEAETCKQLQEISPPYIRMRNPVDIWPSAVVHGIEYAYGKGLEAVLRDPNIDAVVPILMLTENTDTPPLDFIVDLARTYPDKPIYVTFSADKAYMESAKAFLEPKGVPTFPMLEDAFETLSLLAKCRRAMERG